MTKPKRVKKVSQTISEDFICQVCRGTKLAEPDCEDCDGLGWIDDPADGGTKTCPTCLGDPCEACKGTGEKPE